LLARLADEIIPCGEGFPSASQAGVALEGLDQVLKVRPELTEPLQTLLAAARDKSPREFADHLRSKEPGLFGVLTEAVAGAYFLNRDVRERLGYAGQTAKAIDPRPDYLDDGLLQSVIDRGPVYRPTPK
jgi:hypothetical protein